MKKLNDGLGVLKVVKFSTLLFALSLPACAGNRAHVCNIVQTQEMPVFTSQNCGTGSCGTKISLSPDMQLKLLEPDVTNEWRKVELLGYAQDNTDAGKVGWIATKFICKAGS